MKDEKNLEKKVEEQKWLDWAIELQSLAQAGLAYGKDKFDIERFERIREISAEMVAHKTEISVKKVKDLFCNEVGYQTPKIDVRGVIFEDDKILLIQESNGKWALPGGWADVYLSVKENVLKEVKEEAGIEASAEMIIALLDVTKNQGKKIPYGITKVFVLCKYLSGKFEKNIETIDSRYFEINELPELETKKITVEQIKMCFEANRNRDRWKVVFD